MRKLDRNAVTAPKCLANYSGLAWNALAKNDKEEIYDSLEVLQKEEGNVKCAYCETFINNKRRHIEHFYPRRNFQDLTFDWDNLFLSCGYPNHCGHYKDKHSYDINNLIKPDRDNPDDFLKFNSNGQVVYKYTNSPNQTIEILNLNEPSLVSARANAIKPYKENLEEIMNLGYNAKTYIEKELEDAKKQEHSTAIRHFLYN
ncbi:MAG: TIGR02646 family protein [Fibromonadaceae bacterium]|jgi:uncharacterized protein (TIGR02646 family)|nr:TIGR02646 family protein [Fibromonadaceae bacterium]